MNTTQRPNLPALATVARWPGAAVAPGLEGFRAARDRQRTDQCGGDRTPWRWPATAWVTASAANGDWPLTAPGW